MQVDLRTVAIEPQRHAFDHLVRRFGDKPASRYQEGSYDLQAAENLHYKPTWDPDQTLYDPGISRIVMADWYTLKDPRQYYYGSYILARARQQDATEANFKFVESRNLAASLPETVRATALAVLVPLRHAAWGANQTNAFICGYGFGTAFTQPCLYYGMDQLGIAQYLSRIGLLLGDIDALAAGKQAWLGDANWQPLRRYVEDSLTIRDPFEAFVAQNVALDGLLYPLVYSTIIDGALTDAGGGSLALLTQFMSDWADETRKWIDAVLKVAAAESADNRAVLAEWLADWGVRARTALQPIANIALGRDGEAALDRVQASLHQRLTKAGLHL